MEQQTEYPVANTVVFDVAQREYEKIFEASAKLDNKINVALAFCGVIFFTTIQLLDFSKLDFPINNAKEFVFSASYCICVILAVILYMNSIINFMKLLNPIGYQIINIEDFIYDEMYKEPEQVMKIYLAVKYVEASSRNYEVSNNRAEQYKKAMVKMITSSILIVIAYLIKYNMM